MKFFPVIFFLIISNLGYCQTNLYTFNDDTILSEKMIISDFERISRSLPSGLYIEPIIYHKEFWNDTVINYINYTIRKSLDTINEICFKPAYNQNPLFLLLNKKLPAFELYDIEGEKVISSQIIGTPALINYWAINCAPCIAEIPELNELKARFGSKMNFIAITKDGNDDNQLLRFLDRNPYNFQILLNGREYVNSIGINSIPVNIFIDHMGYVRYIQGAYPDEHDHSDYFIRIIKELINKQ